MAKLWGALKIQMQLYMRQSSCFVKHQALKTTPHISHVRTCPTTRFCKTTTTIFFLNEGVYGHLKQATILNHTTIILTVQNITSKFILATTLSPPHIQKTSTICIAENEEYVSH